MSARGQADITSITKREGVYKVEGVARGKRVSFFVDAPSTESMSRKDADAFFRRSIANLARHEE